MSSTRLKAFIIPPGIQKNETEYLAEGQWVDCDKIRFRNKRPEKIGGWVRENVQQDEDSSNELFTGIARAAISWNDLSGAKYLAVGTHKKIEIMNGNIIYDVTPVRESVTLEDAIETTSGESIVEISDVNHGLVEGDYIFVTSQETAVGGITLAGSYIVKEVIDGDTYTVDAGTNASSSATGGDTLDIDYLLENGSPDNSGITGWGGGTWGTEGAAGQGWNRPRSASGGLAMRQISFDNWGEDLLACVRNGKIYLWDATNGLSTRMQVLANSPDRNLFMLVSQNSRQVIAFGSEVAATSAFDPMIVRWSEEEDREGWAITSTNTAGEYRLPLGNTIVGAVQTRTEIVVFTDTHVYSMRYAGGNNGFIFDLLGSNISVVGQNSFIDINGVVIWIGFDGFYLYDGLVRRLPCSIQKYLFDQDGEGRINFEQKEKTYCQINKEFNEVIIFYPRYDVTENSHYVKYNFEDNVFDYGQLDRTAWIDRGIFEKPYALDATGKLFVHEQGKDADGAPLPAFITTAYFDIDDGQEFLFVDKVIPDVKLPSNRNMAITFYFKREPHPNSDVTVKGPYYFSDSDEKISFRGRGRQMAVNYSVDATGSDFEIGKMRLSIQPDGGR